MAPLAKTIIHAQQLEFINSALICLQRNNIPLTDSKSDLVADSTIDPRQSKFIISVLSFLDEKQEEPTQLLNDLFLYKAISYGEPRKNPYYHRPEFPKDNSRQGPVKYSNYEYRGTQYYYVQPQMHTEPYRQRRPYHGYRQYHNGY
jgi:hypothetical protein